MRIFIGALLTVFTSSCLLSPFDGQQVASPNTPIDFQGMHLTAGANVALEAYDFNASSFRSIGSATASDAGHVATDGTLYGWGKVITLSPAFWAPGSRGLGSHARVRAVTTGSTGLPYTMMSVNQDWATCWTSHGQSIGVFARECAAPNSPVAELHTPDYCDQALDHTEYTGQLFYDAASRRLGARLTISSWAPLLNPRVTLSLARASAPGTTVSATWDSCSGFIQPSGAFVYTCYTSTFRPTTACAYNSLVTGADALVLNSTTRMDHPCHAGANTGRWAARLETCVVPPPPPPPETRPNLVVSLGAHDGVTMPVSVCNVGPGTFTHVASGLLVSVQGSSQLVATLSDVSAAVPNLAAGQCASVGSGFIGVTSGTGGGWYTPSASGSACVDTTDVVNEVSNADNCATRLR